MDDYRKDLVRSTFSKNPDAYVTSETHANGIDLELITEWLDPSPEDIGLDIATGGGHVVKHLAPRIKTLFATDLTKQMLNNTAVHLNDLTNVYYVVADAEELPFLEGTFDIVTCRIAPHHFPNPETFIKEASRVLKTGGAFIMIDNVAPENPNGDTFMNTFEAKRDPSHVRALPINEWKQYVHASRLQLLKSNSRKKTLTFRDWVTRTLDDKNQLKEVENYMLGADPQLKQDFKIMEEEGNLLSFAIDEWMVLCKKI
ncbi:class I SAM-dependent methyltransferase [Thalassobacillus sp. CUG 92003]|uniref:class I SAM-dependent methyltransferase n=1 Tax=Thalassobacillus sp. CUG 92003 TaxID=2736641 RepID=UPI002107AC87|nr:class I SAM-dependent methyltransferase [Thalassobacillus sp. CUG 92003]